MALTRRAATVFSTVAQLAADQGPIVPHYAITLDTGKFYQWTPADITTADDYKVVSHVGGSEGRWFQVVEDDEGDALTDADATILASGKPHRTLPASTLTVNRVLTIGDTNAVAGDRITITRLDTEAFTYQIYDDAGSAGIITLPASEKWFVDIRFDGANWTLERAGKMQ